MASATDKQLREAVNNNDLEALKRLLTSEEIKRKGNLEKIEWVTNGDGAPLQWAANNGRDEMVKLLVKSGVNVNSVAIFPGYRTTALHWAVQGKRASTVKLLLELGADPMLLGTEPPFSGTVAQDSAVILGFPEYGDILKEHTAVVTAASAADPRITKVLISKLKTMTIEEEALAKGMKILLKIKAKETEVKRLSDDIKALRADKDFKTEDELNKMQDCLDQIKELTDALQKVNDLNKDTDDANVCPICFKAPEKIFSCTNDNGECDSWFCITCKEDLTQCPICRAEFNVVPSRRNIQLEKIIFSQGLN